MVLSKSAKIMPGIQNNFDESFILVIIMGSIRKIYTLHAIQYLLATLISMGLILFNSNKVFIFPFYLLVEKFGKW